ncbi:MAG: hypothetical protein HZC40_25890 [Chloroflexi bacterium]|nr:hypothetical protein [Chloroflexota bacterium]
MATVWAKEMASLMRRVTGEAHPDIAARIVLRDAIEYRLEKIENDLRRFESKYGMTFEEYKHRWDTEDHPDDYAFESEMDFLEWEAQVTRKTHLENMRVWLP